MEIKELLKQGQEIWGDKKCDLPQIVVRLGKVFGDICRYARNEKPTDAPNEAELKKELGNLIFCAIRWCDDLGYDPEECVRSAVRAQEKFQGMPAGGEVAADFNGLLALGRRIWSEKRDLEEIIIRMGKVFGDICKYARNVKFDDRAEGEAGLKKELGNVIFSTICWCDDLGYDLEECVNLAIEAQKKYVNMSNVKSNI